MSANPLPESITWSCSCRTVSLPEDVSETRCERCGSPFVRTGIPPTDPPPVTLINPDSDDRPVTLPKAPPRAQQHGNIPGVDLRELLYRAGLRDSDLPIALALYDHRAPGTWSANISQEKIGASVGRSVRTVGRTLDRLHKKGIVLSQQKRRKRGGGHFLEYRLRPFMPESGRTTDRPRMATQIASTRDARIKSASTQAGASTSVGKQTASATTNVRTTARSVAAASAITKAPRATNLVTEAVATCTVCYGTGWAPVVEEGAHKGVRRCGCRQRVSSQHPDKMTGCMHPDILSSIPPETGV